jgi:hypothetical protein
MITNPANEVEDKVAIVTGAASGMRYGNDSPENGPLLGGCR